MATQEVHVKNGIGAAVLIFRSSVYSPTAINNIDVASSTTVDLTLDEGGSGLAVSAAVNSDQVDLGATRAPSYSVLAAIEWFVAVTAGDPVDFWWSPSNNATVTDGNPGLPDGVDGLYAPSGFTVPEGIIQMQYVGSHINNGEIGVQLAVVGEFSPRERYGQLIVVNNSDAIICGTDDIESAIVMTPLLPDIQAAA